VDGARTREEMFDRVDQRHPLLLGYEERATKESEFISRMTWLPRRRRTEGECEVRMKLAKRIAALPSFG